MPITEHPNSGTFRAKTEMDLKSPKHKNDVIFFVFGSTITFDLR